MRIAFFGDSYFPTVDGVVVSMTNAMERLAKKGHEIALFAPSGSYLPDNLKQAGVKLFMLKSFKLQSYKEYKIRIPTFFHALKLAKQFNPDIIHVHSPGGIGMEGLFCARKLKIPVVATSHTVFSGFVKHINLLGLEKIKLFEKIVWLMLRGFFNRFDAIVSPSEPMKKELLKDKVTKPIHVISNGLDTKKFHCAKAKKKFDLLHVGRLSYAKNIIVVLEALKVLSEKKIKPKMIIAGRGPELKNLKKFAEKNRLNVEFIGLVPQKKLIEMYNNAKIFATASTIETEGLVILEAMACGLPIAAVNALAIPSIVQNNINGLLAEPFNAEQLASNIEKMLNSAELRKKFSKNSLRIVKKYDLSIMNNKLEALYLSLVKKRNK